MTDLVAYLRARLDEEEATAHAAYVSVGDPGGETQDWQVAESPVPDFPPHVNVGVESHQDWLILDATTGSVAERRAIAGHAAYWQPSRVLADITAKRAALDLWERGYVVENGAEVPDEVLCILAQPYAGRDDFRPEWHTP